MKRRPNRTYILPICPGCGKAFQRANRRQIYHSKQCKDKHWREVHHGAA